MAFTFCYTTVTIFSYSYGIFATFITRLVSQLMGCLLAAFCSIFIFPVSGVRLAASATEEALYKLQLATGSLIRAMEAAKDPDPDAFNAELDQAVAHIADVDAAVKLILAHVGSLKQYPVLSKVFSRSRKLLELLFGYSVTVRSMTEVVRSLTVIFRRQRGEEFSVFKDGKATAAFDTALLKQLESQRRSLIKYRQAVVKAYSNSIHGPSVPVSFGVDRDNKEAEDVMEQGEAQEDGDGEGMAPEGKDGRFKASPGLEKLVSELRRLLASRSPATASELETRIRSHVKNESNDPELTFAYHKTHLTYVMTVSEVILQTGF